MISPGPTRVSALVMVRSGLSCVPAAVSLPDGLTYHSRAYWGGAGSSVGEGSGVGVGTGVGTSVTGGVVGSGAGWVGVPVEGGVGRVGRGGGGGPGRGGGGRGGGGNGARGGGGLLVSVTGEGSHGESSEEAQAAQRGHGGSTPLGVERAQERSRGRALFCFPAPSVPSYSRRPVILPARDALVKERRWLGAQSLSRT